MALGDFMYHADKRVDKDVGTIILGWFLAICGILFIFFSIFVISGVALCWSV